MSPAASYDEEKLADLIAALRPAPEGWVQAAAELPRVERGLEQILVLAEADAEFRAALLEDLEQAVARAGFDPEPALVRQLERRLTAPQDQGVG